MSNQSFELPAGLIDSGGRRHQETELQPLCGRDEEFLAGASGASAAALVTALLARCVKRIGGFAPVAEEHVRSLLVADRQYLLLRLRAASFGPQVSADVPCAWPDCGRKFTVSFSVDDIPVEAPEPLRSSYTLALPPEARFTGPDGRSRDRLGFRLPNGADQEAVADLARTDEARAATRLMERCLVDTGGVEPGDLVACFTPRTRAALEAEMARVAPRLETTLETACPECGREVGIPLDIHEFFLGDLRIGLDLLRREVHYLAFHYHWGEGEIMAMPRKRRREYIRVLAEEIEQMSDAL